MILRKLGVRKSNEVPIESHIGHPNENRTALKSFINIEKN